MTYHQLYAEVQSRLAEKSRVGTAEQAAQQEKARVDYLILGLFVSYVNVPEAARVFLELNLRQSYDSLENKSISYEEWKVAGIARSMEQMQPAFQAAAPSTAPTALTFAFGSSEHLA